MKGVLEQMRMQSDVGIKNVEIGSTSTIAKRKLIIVGLKMKPLYKMYCGKIVSDYTCCVLCTVVTD